VIARSCGDFLRGGAARADQTHLWSSVRFARVLDAAKGKAGVLERALLTPASSGRFQRKARDGLLSAPT
jgi:hypothetical protein